MHVPFYRFCSVFSLMMGIIFFGSAHAKPPELSTIMASSPYGAGTLKKFMLHVYDAELWTDASEWSYDAPFALSITYTMNFSTDELINTTFSEMVRIHGKDRTLLESYRTVLQQAFPPVVKHDRITALYTPKKGVTFYHQATRTAHIESDIFARDFFDIWLSEATAKPELRRQLLEKKHE